MDQGQNYNRGDCATTQDDSLFLCLAPLPSYWPCPSPPPLSLPVGVLHVPGVLCAQLHVHLAASFPVCELTHFPARLRVLCSSQNTLQPRQHAASLVLCTACGWEGGRGGY